MRYVLGLAALALLLAPTAAACTSTDGAKAKLSPGDELDVNTASGGVICTLAFLVASPDALYFATAGHCIHVNDTASNPDVGNFGKGAFHYLNPETGSESDGSPGEDFALIRIDPSFYDRVSPTECYWGGPKGLYTDTPGSGGVKHFGHGEGPGDLGPTQPRQGLNLQTDAKAFYWTGFGVPGDSGSAVLSDDLKAVGVLTHLVVSPPDDNGGTRLARGFQLAAAAGFTDLRLVLDGEDPVAVMSEMRAERDANLSATPLAPANGTGPSPATPTSSANGGNSTAPAENGSPPAGSATSAELQPAASEGGVTAAQHKTPAPTLTLALGAVLVALLARRLRG
jgi:hypothetical protein